MRAEADFWQKYQAVRKSKMPVRSDIYEYLDESYRLRRKQFRKDWGSHYDKPLPTSAIKFYNRAFAQGLEAVRQVFERFPVPAASQRKAEEAYDIQLPKNARFRDLFKLDIFAEKTVNQDIHPEMIYQGIQKFVDEDPAVLSDTHHFFYHRPQKTEFIFLHEIIVGYLLHIVSDGPEIMQRREIPLHSDLYPPFSAYTMRRLGDLLGMTDGEMVALHLEDSATLKKRLPPFVQELLLVSSHIYWYMDLYSKWTDTFYPSDLLRINYMFFLVPSIERQMAEGNLRLRRSAGQFVDREFIERIFSQYSARGGTFNQIDLVQILFRLVENLWLKRE